MIRRKITIVDPKDFKNFDIDSKDPIAEITIEHLDNLLESRGQEFILINFYLPESYILSNKDKFDKDLLLQSDNFSESFIRQSLKEEYISVEDLKILSLTTYSNLSSEFVEEYSNDLNWAKIILYMSSMDINIEKYISIIESNNLWPIISANNLSIKFIREHKDKLDWRILSFVRPFNEEEINELQGYILVNKNTSMLNTKNPVILQDREEVPEDTIRNSKKIQDTIGEWLSKRMSDFSKN